ncbi:MAG: EAL domain-containing protein [Pseudomonadota bacterium]
MDIKTIIGNVGAYTNEAILIADADVSDGAVLTIRWVNPAFGQLLGYSSDEVIGKTARVLVGPTTSPGTHARIITRLEAWEAFSSDLKIVTRDGTEFWAQLSFQPVRDIAGTVAYWICLIRDISARKAVEAQLTDLSLIAQTTRDMVAVLDRDRLITWVNPSFLSASGFTVEEVTGRRVGDVLAADTSDTEAVQELIRLLDRSKPAHMEVLSKRKDGSLFLGDYEFQPIFDEDGMLEKYVTLIRDITERRMLEMRYKAVFDETNAAISIKSAGRFIMVNRRFAEDFGKTVEDFSGQLVSDVLSGEPLLDLESVERDVLATGEGRQWERTILGQDNRFRHELTKTFRVFDPLLNANLICSVATDVTEIRQAQEKLRSSQRAAEAAERRLWGALDAMPEGFVLYDTDDRLVMFNRAFRNIYARLGDRLKPGIRYRDVLEAGLETGQWDIGDQDPQAWLQDHLEERDAKMQQGLFVPLADNKWVLCKEVVLENGERAGVRVESTGVKRREAELRHARREAERAERRLLAAMNTMGDGFTIYDAEDRVVLSNMVMPTGDGGQGMPKGTGTRYIDILKYGLSTGLFVDAIGREEEWLAERLAFRENPGESMDQVLSDGRIFRVFESKTEDGDTVTFRLDITKQREQEQRLADYARDLEATKAVIEERNSALEEAQSDLEYASLHDALTNLPNRRYLDHELRRRTRSSDYDPDIRPTQEFNNISVLHIDLDRFKQINDSLGHAAGDHVLCHVAQVLRTETRAGDFAARVGGDEFVILCHGGRDHDQLGQFARRIVDALSTPIQFEGQECRFGASIGIAMGNWEEIAGDLSEDETPARQLLINADIALYKAKAAGRNRWAYFSDELQAEVLEAKTLSDDILRAIDLGAFEVAYQPQICAHNGEIVGVEALVRWPHPSRGVLLPSDFMSVAMDLNVLPQIDALVMEKAIRDDAVLRREGLLIPRLSVNVSGWRLRDRKLIEDIKAGDINPQRLSVEILESVFVDDDDEVLNWNIDQLREMGVDIELDDFGTGHSSLVGLIRLKPHRLKIDRSFIEQTLTTDTDATVIRALVQIGRSLGVEVVAEGIETLEQGGRLAALGCDVLQGYAYAPPMTATELAAFMRARLPEDADIQGTAR